MTIKTRRQTGAKNGWSGSNSCTRAVQAGLSRHALQRAQPESLVMLRIAHGTVLFRLNDQPAGIFLLGGNFRSC